MIELPEALTLAMQLNSTLYGKIVSSVLPPSKEHKFCWYAGDPSAYDSMLKGRKVCTSEGFGIFVELAFDNGQKLCVYDGVNLRLVGREEAPKAYQLLILFDDDTALAFTVAMYGGIILHDGSYDNEYYLKSRNALSPFSNEFPDYFYKTLESSSPKLSAKAFLATEQRFPGLGNGVLQDILFAARIHPKRKLSTLNEAERETLLTCTVDTLRQMAAQGGRDTEKDILGVPGGYITKLSKNTLKAGCPVCGGPISKEAYLGGSVYYCPACQKAIK